MTASDSAWRAANGVALGVAEIATVTTAIWALKPVIPVSALSGLYVLTILPIAVGWGLGLALAVAVASALTFDLFFTPPLFVLTLTDADTIATLVISAVIATVVSGLSGRVRRRASEAEALARDARRAEERTRRIADEQAGLRRVATLVARGATPAETFDVVAAEVGQLFGAQVAVVFRFEPDRTGTVVGLWSVPGVQFPGGARLTVAGVGVAVRVLETGRPTRTERFEGPEGSIADSFARIGARSGVGAPIIVEGQLWGAVVAVATRPERLPAGSEAGIAGFTELVATAIANAEARSTLRRVADEQAALRRVAVLVARTAPPEEVFAAVCQEAGRLLPADLAAMGRFEPDGQVVIVGTWRTSGSEPKAGDGAPLGGRNVSTLVYQTGRPVRLDGYGDASGAAADVARQWGIRSSVGVPISAESRLWGLMFVASTPERLPADTEVRLTGFTELVVTAIANAQARLELRAHADEQSALRRVATLVAHAAPPAAVFAAVSEEIGQLLGCDFTVMNRYDADNMISIVGTWSGSGRPVPVAVGTRVPLEGRNATMRVFRTGRPVRIDGYDDDAGAGPASYIAAGMRTSVGAPISVQGRLWGVMIAASREELLPADAEARLAGFTELVATAIANAESQAQLAASRARIVTTADHTMRRIERDLHDGTQQRLVSLALQVRAAREAVPPGADALTAQLDSVVTELAGVLDELREIARGIHPAVLTEGGLPPALKALARRSPLAVDLDLRTERRLPEQVEVAAYYVISEALTNASKHANASRVGVRVELSDGRLRVTVSDDGVGGADPSAGSGIVGLMDRVEALGGTITLISPPGEGTSLVLHLPVEQASGQPVEASPGGALTASAE